MNKVLTYREVSVYLQLSLDSKGGRDTAGAKKPEVYQWGLEQLAKRLGWKRTNALYACLEKLVDAGFLIRTKVPLPGPRKYRVNVYQRPAVGYTLKRLRDAGYVGPGRSVSPEEFAEACALYERWDKPKELAGVQFDRSKGKGVTRIGIKKQALRST